LSGKTEVAHELKKYVRYYVQKRKQWGNDTTTPRPIVLAFNYDGKRLCTLTGLKLADKDWDAKRQRAKLTVKRANQFNQILEGLQQKVNDIYFSAKAEGVNTDNNYILKNLKQHNMKTTKPSFFAEWAKYLDIQKNKMKKGTIKSMWTSYNHMQKFCKGKSIDFDDITPELLSYYSDYLLKCGNVNNTIHGNIKRLRIFMNYAKKIGLHKNDKYKEFNMPEKVGRIKFLDWEEIKLLMDYKPISEFEQKILDNFLIGCATGLRHSDYQNLKKEDIKEKRFDGDNEVYIVANVRQLKTDNITAVPLLGIAQEILKRYKNIPGEFALPRITNQVINRHIKLIGKKAGLNNAVAVDIYRGDKRETKYYKQWQLLTTHYGRRSFVSLAASRGIPMNIISSITGQSTKVMMKHYAGVIDKQRFSALKNMSFKKE